MKTDVSFNLEMKHKKIEQEKDNGQFYKQNYMNLKIVSVPYGLTNHN